jgi:hypothetical protein
MSRTRAVSRESWKIGRTHDGNALYAMSSNRSVVIGVVLYCERTARVKAGGTWLIKF